MRTAFSLPLVLFLIAASLAQADSFGTGANLFNIEFVTIGDPGNVADTTGVPNPAGSVPHIYRIGKFEISEQMIDKANAAGGLDITKFTRSPNKPASDITWYEAAKFVNWLNTSTGNSPAYKFDGGGNFQLWTPSDAGYNASNLYRNSLARYFLPSADEWYKAAYFDASAGGYHGYPTGSSSVPDGIDSPGDIFFDAVFLDVVAKAQPNDITDVGVLSPYGTAGQGGNIWEWEETDLDLVNDSVSSPRGLRGGSWVTTSNFMSSSSRSSPPHADASIGFRVASVVPEPSSLLLGLIAFVSFATARRKSS